MLHLVVVVNGTTVSDGISYYKNGVEVNSETGNIWDDYQVTFRPGSGILKDPINNSSGWIDELCFWNRRLDAQEIKDLYESYNS